MKAVTREGLGTMEEGGKQKDLGTGAVRDVAEGKPMLSLISPFFTQRLGNWLTLGADRYGARNWEQGMPFARTLDSLERHIVAFKEGEATEDHLAAVAVNAMFIMHYQEMIKRGVLPESLNDMPDYTAKS
jgi:hypothetical protein